MEDGISSGVIQPQEEVYFQWKVDKDKFQYTDKGITGSSAHGQYTTKRSWLRASIKVEETIKQHGDYSFALEQLDDKVFVFFARLEIIPKKALEYPKMNTRENFRKRICGKNKSSLQPI